MRILTVLALLVAVICPASAETITGHVRVVDGDSLKMGDINIRLEGIDAPEWGQLCYRAGRAYRCGLVAKDALRDIIADRPVTCDGVVQPNGTVRDAFGRFLGMCRSAAGTIINGWMVLRGHAVAFRRYSLEFIPQEDDARLARRGMWAGPFMEPQYWRAAKKADRGGW